MHVALNMFNKETPMKASKQMLAPPPWHSVALVGLIAAVFSSMFPSMDIVDQDATIETFTHRIFPDLISLEMLGWIRCIFAAIIFSTSFWATFVSSGWQQITTYLPGSKLKKNVTIHITGYRTQLPFTSWSWNLLGASFALNSAIAFMANHGMADKITPWMLRAALFMFETAGPTALLVACVTRYALWSHALRAGGDTSLLKSPMVLMWHNANVIMVLMEASLLGGLPVRYGHVGVVPFFGIAYVLFTWYMASRWVPSGGSQFVYFFLDTTLGATTSFAILALLVILMVFFGLFGLMDHMLEHLGGGLVVHALAALFVSSLVCRFRD